MFSVLRFFPLRTYIIITFLLYFPIMILEVGISAVIYTNGILFQSEILRRYGRNRMAAVDQLGNTILGGDYDETLSGRLGRALLSNRPHFLAYWLSRFVDYMAFIIAGEENHCINSLDELENPEEKEIFSFHKGK
jgi:hypothetical protein